MKRDMNEFKTAIEQNGFAIAEQVIGEGEVATLRDAMASLPETEDVRKKSNVYGIRHQRLFNPPTSQSSGKG